MIAPVRLALFGVGSIGARHLALASEEPACQIVAAADPVSGAAAVLKHHGARFYTDYRKLLAKESVDGAIIATPNDHHLDVARACIAEGLPVLVEKPITDTVAAGETLVFAAEKAGVAVAVGHHRRFDSAVETAREILAGDRIGRLAAVECIWSMRKHDTYYEADWRRRRPSGGPILINLIHDIDMLRYLCGEVVRVQAEAGNAMRGNEVEDTVAVTLRFSSGALGTVLASDAAPSPWGWEQATGENPEIPATGRNCYRFLGAEGALEFPQLALWRHDGETADWHRPLQSEVIESRPRAALKLQLTHFCGVVRGEHEPRVSGRDGLGTLATALAIHAAAVTGGPVEVSR